ncbi:MAG: hypothetical protein FJ119_12245 [Deltaproteobacteria bacterium]|nr:hypothetical protein [Deltaproteobacteria bacterium]
MTKKTTPPYCSTRPVFRALATACLLAIALSMQSAWAGSGTRVRAEGHGSIIQGDMAQARDEALIDARVRALENACGIAIDSRTVIQDEQLLDASLISLSRGHIESYRIIDEGPSHNGLYRIMIEAVVSAGEHDSQLLPVGRNPAVMITLSETGAGTSVSDGGIVAGGVLRAVAREGYAVNVPSYPQTARPHSKTGSPAADCILVNGRSTVLYSQTHGGIVACRATSRIALIEKGSDTIIASCSLQAKGFGLCQQQAGRAALSRISRTASSFVVEQLSHYTGRQERTIVINVLDGEGATHYNRLRNLLQSMRWVTSLDEGRRENGQSIFQIRYAEKTNYLTRRLARIPWVELVDYNWNTIDLRLIDEGQRCAYEF